MMIDRNADVTPHRYESPLLRRAIGRRIGHADRDDMLRALLWSTEVRIAAEVTLGWRELFGELRQEVQAAERRRDRLSWQGSDQVARRCRKAAIKLLIALQEEQRNAAEAIDHCMDLTDEFRNCLGTATDDRQEPLADARGALAALNDELSAARSRFTDRMDEDRKELHRLAELERKRRDAPGPTIRQLDGMQQDEFDTIVQQALERSGFRTRHRAPRVIEVSRGRGRGLVYCANVQEPDTEKMVHVRDLVAVQRLAEVSGTGSVLLVSNLPYISRAALRHLEGMSCDVKHVDRFDLQQWIEWGTPLQALEAS
ncbi:hypothetical protein ABZ766_33985 [Streptomyces sp. NPDC006670]|uniref:hypothetical protein n=1 Tax=Streptomyces sp. NPDC006670 TaxID=3154476 RepID=UPI0033DBF6A3